MQEPASLGPETDADVRTAYQTRQPQGSAKTYTLSLYCYHSIVEVPTVRAKGCFEQKPKNNIFQTLSEA